MKLDKKNLGHLAKLSRLKIDESKLDQNISELSNILDFVEKLQEVKGEGDAPSYFLTEKNITRKDKTHDAKNQLDILDQAPEKKGSLFKTKPPIE